MTLDLAPGRPLFCPPPGSLLARDFRPCSDSDNCSFVRDMIAGHHFRAVPAAWLSVREQVTLKVGKGRENLFPAVGRVAAYSKFRPLPKKRNNA